MDGTTGWGWLALALVNAGLAEQKNRSRWNWFVISLLIGPLATAMIVIWPRVEPGSAPTQVSSALLVACSSVLALGAIVSAAFAIFTGEWMLWIVCGATALGTGAFAVAASRARSNPLPPTA
ncbi:hypothetical protein [Diaminobutyricibacter sp. McL0608]|uniref:hypothetical protein n=1 Tax=Leifsonia sp. McL0608 TaxID=3143537 RepID=UPI0031F2E4F0